MTDRLTPYDLAFDHDDLESRVFPDIREEAGTREIDARDPERFAQLGTVGAEIRDLLAAISPDARPGPLVEQAAMLYYHGFHFWAAGKPTGHIDESDLRRMLDPDAAARAPGAAPVAGDTSGDAAADSTARAQAGYVQLPTNLVWARTDPNAIHEPVDGFFWTFGPGHGGGAESLSLLFALGVRAGRPGFSVIPVRADVPAGGLTEWAATPARSEGDDFANVLPGGELDRLHALTTPAEALRFAALALLREAGET